MQTQVLAVTSMLSHKGHPCYHVQGAEVQQRKLQQQLSATERRAREQQRSLQQELDAARNDLEAAQQQLAEVTFSRLSCA